MIIHNKPVKFCNFDPDHRYEICAADVCCCVTIKKLNFGILSSLPNLVFFLHFRLFYLIVYSV